MIFKYVCISIGFTFKSGSKMKFADNTLKKSPCILVAQKTRNSNKQAAKKPLIMR